MQELISVIISTYNQPDWLEKSLWGFHCQTDAEFEVIIADDGSDSRTAARIESLRPLLKFPIHHVWQRDEGFRKSAILNKATTRAHGEYLIFTDGDCIPPVHFVRTHRAQARPGNYLSGAYFKLPMQTSLAIDRKAITAGNAFNKKWLKANGLHRGRKPFRLCRNPVIATLLDILVPTKATWDGNNSSTYKNYILAVNGHDERLGYGGQDVEMGVRLNNLGIQGKRIRHRTRVLHLDHERLYATAESIAANLEMRQLSKASKATWTPCGIVAEPPSALARSA